MFERWIVPCNLKHFNIQEHFAINKTVVWKNSFTIRVEDLAYIYISAPISAIKYRCRVVADDVSDEMLNANKYAIPKRESHNYFSKRTKYIVLKLEKEYPDDFLTLEALRQHGLGQVQIQARIDRRLGKYIEEIDNIKPMDLDGGDSNA